MNFKQYIGENNGRRCIPPLNKQCLENWTENRYKRVFPINLVLFKKKNIYFCRKHIKACSRVRRD